MSLRPTLRSAQGPSRRISPVAFALLAAACAGERTPIDRTQPNALDKEVFQGEWYFGQTVVDIPGTLSPTFVGENTFQGMERIRWDLQEDWLYARRSYERIKGAEGSSIAADGSTPDGRPYLGAVIAAYEVVSHFDIRRAYNPTTGEEYNVLEENTTDRPWHERRYMRVDWSQNHATNFEFLVDDVQHDAVAYYVQDPSDPDYPVIDAGEFDAAGNMLRQPYIDVTNVLVVKPGMTYIPEIDESYPTCWLFGHDNDDCTAQPIKLRNSFLRIDPNRQYVPRKFKGKVTDHFGIFTQDRLVWNPQDDLNERNRESYAQLHNLWAYWYDENGNLTNPDQRALRPMVYYAVGWPERLRPTIRSVEARWDEIFRRVVSASVGYLYEGPVFKVCTSPVPADEAGDLCGPEGFQVRVGDIRYSMLVFVPDYYDGFKLLGFGPSNSDPLTGEVISGMAYLYGAWNDNRIQITLDQLRLLNGDLDPTDYIDGVDLTPWQYQAAKDGSRRRTVADDEVTRWARAQNYDWTAALGVHATPGQLAGLDGKPMRQVIQQLGPQLYQAGLYSGERDDSDGRLASLQNTYIEKQLMNDEIRLIAGIPADAPVNGLSAEMMRAAAVTRLGPVELMKAIDRYKQDLVARRSLDLFGQTADDGLVGLADQYRGMPEEQLRTMVDDSVYHAVLSHELGHTFSLHHNMGGTEDAVNYDDMYWVLRAQDGTVRPRWQDPLTDAELAGRIYSYAYSSIMDYSRLTLDYAPGKYDAAAVMLAYANKVETFKNVGSVPTGQIDMFNEWAQADGQPLVFTYPKPTSFHYTEFWNRMGDLLYRADNRELVDADGVNWDTGRTTDGKVRVPYIFCSPYQTDISSSCLTRDYGADEYERIQAHIQYANTWYVQRAFTRYRVGLQNENYIGSTYERTYDRLKGYNDYYALIVGILETFIPQASLDEFLADGTAGWGAYTIAEHDIVNFLLSTISTPDVTGYELGTDPAGRELYTQSLFTGAPVNTDVVNGRYFTTTWFDTGYDDECGMNFFQCLHHFGFYFDKVMALHALTDARTNFVARDTAADVRQFRVSFWDNYSDVINDYMGALLAQDYAGYAPHWTAAGQTPADHVQYPDFAGKAPAACPPGAPTCTLKPLDPAAGFTVQLYAAVLGMARLQNNFDKSFLDSTRMWLAGSGLEVSTAQGWAEFADPRNGKLYRAIDLSWLDRDGATLHYGVARRMLERANRLKSRSTWCTSGCEPGVTPEDKARADGELLRYGDLLDLMVDLTGYYETYTQGYGNPYDPGAVP